jgi:hypothetical protein
MSTTFGPDDDPRTAFQEFTAAAARYFERAIGAVGPAAGNELLGARLFGRDDFWDRLSPDIRQEAERLNRRLLDLAGRVIDDAKHASLTSEADQTDVREAAKAMRAAIFLRQFHSWGADLLHDEGQVLGFSPAGQREDSGSHPEYARKEFATEANRIEAVMDLIAASGRLTSRPQAIAIASARYRPNTAFIMMSMDQSRPELSDVADAVKEVFERFGVHAVRSDDIEHEEQITKRILDEIKTAEFCFSDLTGERPNVYYEVGYAHAHGRRVILFRKKGTGLHFDLAGYNCPEYENLRDLKTKLTKRLVYLTNRQPTSSPECGAAPSAG